MKYTPSAKIKKVLEQYIHDSYTMILSGIEKDYNKNNCIELKPSKDKLLLVQFNNFPKLNNVRICVYDCLSEGCFGLYGEISIRNGIYYIGFCTKFNTKEYLEDLL
jgi:hypothetical protein